MKQLQVKKMKQQIKVNVFLIGLIIRKELLTLFLSPFGWLILIIFQIILAFEFLNLIESYLQFQQQITLQDQYFGLAEWVIKPFYAALATVILLIIPIVSAHLVTSEKKNGTLPLLLLAPINNSIFVIAKLLSILSFVLIITCLSSLMPLSLYLSSSIDIGRIFSAVLGIILISCALASMCIFLSSLTQHSSIATLLGFSMLLIMWVSHWSIKQTDSEGLISLSFLHHFEPFLQGFFSLNDLVFFTLVSLFFMVVNIKKINFNQLPH